MRRIPLNVPHLHIKRAIRMVDEIVRARNVDVETKSKLLAIRGELLNAEEDILHLRTRGAEAFYLIDVIADILGLRRERASAKYLKPLANELLSALPIGAGAISKEYLDVSLGHDARGIIDLLLNSRAEAEIRRRPPRPEAVYRRVG